MRRDASGLLKRSRCSTSDERAESRRSRTFAGCVLAFKLMVLLQLQALPAQDCPIFAGIVPYRPVAQRAHSTSVRPSQRCPAGPPQSRGACAAGCAELVLVLAWGNDSWLFLDCRRGANHIRRGLQQEPAGSAGEHLRVALLSRFAIRDVEVSC